MSRDDIGRALLMWFALLLVWCGFTGRGGAVLAALLAPADLIPTHQTS